MGFGPNHRGGVGDLHLDLMVLESNAHQMKQDISKKRGKETRRPRGVTSDTLVFPVCPIRTFVLTSVHPLYMCALKRASGVSTIVINTKQLRINRA